VTGKRYKKGEFLEGEVSACFRPTDRGERIRFLGTRAGSYIPKVSEAIPGVEWEVKSWCCRQFF